MQPEAPGTRYPSLSRRGFLTAAATAAGAVAAGPLLAGCGSSGAKTGTTSQSALQKILPTYVPQNAVTPDIPGVRGSSPGFLRYPTNLVKTVGETPGAGGSYTAVTPLWGSIPSAAGNHYYAAVNRALGANLRVQPANGNTFNTILPPMFAARNLPDWICLPSWNTDSTHGLNFGEAVGALFVDLTPYLSGDNIKKYPNLAAIPTNAWQACVWGEKIYGLPVFPGGLYTNTLYYRKDILDSLGIKQPMSADELFNVGREITNPNTKRWAFGDLWTELKAPFGIPAGLNWTTDDKGALIYQYETPQFIEALRWQQKAFAAGLVHPDDVAGDLSNAKQRFYSGQTVIYGDGVGAWDEAVKGQTPVNPKFNMQAFAPFTASGTGTPGYDIINGATIFSYLNRKLSAGQIQELLRIANFLAAPFGSYEYTLVTFGDPAVDYTRSGDGPPTPTAVGQKEVATSYGFLATGPGVVADAQYPDYVKAYTRWEANAARYQRKPLFYDMNISEPAQYASLNQPVEDIIKDVNRNRKGIADFQAAVATWRRNGGDNLRKFYEDIRSKYGTGQ
jgi:putative aldouronate transport system substrate-binding protein